MDPDALASLAAAGVVRWLTHKPGDIPVCRTRIVRVGRGLPWNKRVAIHPMEDGSIEMKAVP